MPTRFRVTPTLSLTRAEGRCGASPEPACTARHGPTGSSPVEGPPRCHRRAAGEGRRGPGPSGARREGHPAPARHGQPVPQEPLAPAARSAETGSGPAPPGSRPGEPARRFTAATPLPEHRPGRQAERPRCPPGSGSAAAARPRPGCRRGGGEEPAAGRSGGGPEEPRRPRGGHGGGTGALRSAGWGQSPAAYARSASGGDSRSRLRSARPAPAGVTAGLRKVRGSARRGGAGARAAPLRYHPPVPSGAPALCRPAPARSRAPALPFPGEPSRGVRHVLALCPAGCTRDPSSQQVLGADTRWSHPKGRRYFPNAPLGGLARRRVGFSSRLGKWSMLLGTLLKYIIIIWNCRGNAPGS